MTGFTTGRPATPAALAAVLVLAAAGCATAPGGGPTGPSGEPIIEQEPPAEAKLETRVKVALVDDPEIDAAAVFVETPGQDRIRLGGFVDNASQRQRAERIARSVSGVAAVENVIEIR